MCEQTEISYLDGDVVWVKLGACWWPGQVTGFHNLPEDIQNEFQRKPLIAAVKFFQEDTYEFVKNYQQIYKYNCTLKDEFIKKGLDKHRSKSKDGASYMAKFPGDVEMAEKLTGGDPDILNSEKFSPEERPDISGLFGDKKMPKKKKEREDGHRRSADIIRKITHPRFLRESDHEVRIRQQPSSLHSTPNSSISSPQYPCHLCEFTSSRVNVIICHIKSHRSGNSSMARSKVKTYSQPRSRNVDTDTPKRKYVRKEKSQWAKSKTDSGFESGKRKQTKQSDKVNKKKKTDPELREKLLADWDDESDEDICNSDSMNVNLTNSSLQPEQSSINSHTSRVENETAEDAIEIIEETEKFLRETEKLRSIRMMEETIGGNISNLKSLGSEKSEKQIGFTKCNTVVDTDTKLQKKGEAEAETVSLENDSKHVASDRDDKKSRLSCFDFDEDDLPEPSIPPVRKIPRVFGEKSLSLKKEIIKEFEMSEALKAEQQKESDKENMSQAITGHVIDTRSSDTEMVNEEGEPEAETTSDSLEKGIPVPKDVSQSKVNVKNEVLLSRNDQQKQIVNPCETEVEIVEIFEVEKEEGDEDRTTGTTKSMDGESHCNNMKTTVSNVNNKTLTKTNSEAMKTDRKESQPKEDDIDNVVTESSDNASTKELDETFSEQLVTETEDDTVSESAETLPEQSENSDSDLVEKNRISMSSMLSARQQVTPEKLVKRKRGRPRKKVESADASVSGKSLVKVKDKEESKTTLTVENIATPNNERSYTGRKRKPNKKYLESGIYVQDSDQRSFKTDDSQSESDEKVVEKQTSKPKRNKALTMLDKNTDSSKKNEERELELSDGLLNTSESKSSKSGLPHNVSDGTKGKKFIGLEKRLIENQPDIVDTCEQSTKNSGTSSILENVNVIVPEHVPPAPGKDTMLQETKPKVAQKEMISAAGSVNEMDKGSKVMSTKDNRIKAGADNSSNHTQSDASRGGIDMLPPKKSQIKKFELSKNDFSSTGDPESNTNIDLDKIKKAKRIEVVGDDIKMNTEKESLDAPAIRAKEVESVGSILREQAKDITVKSTTDKLTDKLMADEANVPEQDTTVVSRNVSEPPEKEPANEQLTEYRLKSTEQILDEVITKTLNEQSPLSKRSSMQTRYKGKFTPETGTKSKRDKELFTEEKPVNTFQEAFLKTLQIDKKKGANDDGETAATKMRKGKKTAKRKSEEQSTGNVLTIISQDAKHEDSEGKSEVAENSCDIKMQQSISEVPALSNFEEVVTEETVGTDAASENVVLQSSHRLAPTKSDFSSVLKVQTHLKTDDASKSAISEVQKNEDSSKTSPAPTSDVSVPVKKREMPRIIENVTLTEPMQILKSKLLDKLPQKGVKHKLESEGSKKPEIKTGPTKAKIMKIESLPTSSKLKTGLKVTSPHLSLTKKLQVLKAEEAEAAAMDKQKEKLSTQTKQPPTMSSVPEKYIQQSSQSLADMELDINSMPFVLSEDVLTPESMEQMPVVISSIIPASSSIPATLSFTPGTQIVTTNQAQFQMAGDNTTEASPTKKKSGTPAILKSKNKAKPTITSIKTLVPPLTGGVKGLKFQSAQTAKSQPVLTQKGTPGKYVVVQTGGQQLRYTVQGRVGAQQKIALPAGKTSSNAQVVQQGNKVVILTSAQSGQTKMLPLNISKTISGKVQRIMTSKNQVFCPINPQSIITSKTVIAPKGDAASATTSKLSSGQKVINTQGILTSKGLLTPVTGTITKTAPLLGNLQGIIMKEGFISGKTIIGPKTVMARNAILSTQSLGSSKAIFTPISQTITSIPGKPILGTSGICAKGTVLTPITGQQVKAIAAKSPSKSKVQYQSVQQKVQLPMLQKSPKTTVSASSQPRGSIPFNSSALSLKTTALILQNVMPSSKVMTSGKKVTKTGIPQQSTTLQSVPSQSSTQEQMISIQQQKGKTVTSPSVQKVFVPRGSGRQTKSQQKIVVQKVQDPAISQVHNIQSKQGITMSSSNVSLAPKATQRYGSGMAGLKFATKTQSTARNLQQQKNLLNIGAGVSNVASSTTPTGICSSDINAAVSTVAASATVNAATMVTTAISAITTSSTANTSTLTSMSLPPLEPLESEVKLRSEEPSVGEQTSKEQQKIEKYVAEKGNEVEKVEETKIAAQPQIMALPTESSDGTQTYVLVTIDEHGQIQPLDNNTLMSLEGTTQNPDGTRTLYIDPSSLGEAGTLDNIVLQFDSGVLPSVQTNVTESNQPTITESFSTPEIMQTSNQDILAAALANTDFQQEINLPENSTGSVMSAGLTQTSLINQTILQSTIIPPIEPISSPSVLETSLTLNQPIMTPLEVPSNLAIQPEVTATSVVSTIPSSLELPITITNPSISYITAGGTQLQIPGNSMPDIGEIMESPSTGEIPHTEIPASTQYLVIPSLDENMSVENQTVESGRISMPTVSYAVPTSKNVVLEATQVQTTPSMPIIDDSFVEGVQFPTSMDTSIGEEQESFTDVPVSEMLISKADIVESEGARRDDVEIAEKKIVSLDISGSSQNKSLLSSEAERTSTSTEQAYTSDLLPVSSKSLNLKESTENEEVVMDTGRTDVANKEDSLNRAIVDDQVDPVTTNSMPIIDETSLITSVCGVSVPSTKQVESVVTESSEIVNDILDKAESKKKDLSYKQQIESSVSSPVSVPGAQTTEDTDAIKPNHSVEILSMSETLGAANEERMEVDEVAESKDFVENKVEKKDSENRLESDIAEPSSQGEMDCDKVGENLTLPFAQDNAETSQEIPSQSYERSEVSEIGDSGDLPSQSLASKSENSREPSQSVSYERIEADEEAAVAEPPTQSFEHSKTNEASQSYEISPETSVNAPTQSFSEVKQSEGVEVMDEAMDDQSYPTQSYEIDKPENLPENLEPDAEISQEGNIPSQSNDIGNDGIGTSSVSTNNSSLNEDETASSSYVPETPENQERDQDQESAISTSSYEIPPCEELNIASSSVIPDTSVRAEHTSIHDNGVLEIPTSSYNLNPDITSTHVDSVPTSSYEDQVIVEQNVSTSYEVPISMPGLEETSSRNFAAESTDRRNEPSSYYAHHQEVTASYYESVEQEAANSRIVEEDSQEEVTPSYYEGNPQEASQSYFAPEEATPSYSTHNMSPNYYDPRPESEASQSYYSTGELEKAERSSARNIEASQSFYQEQPDELRLGQEGEATPTYSEGYSVDYALENSPMERHDLVESSVPATRPTER